MTRAIKNWKSRMGTTLFQPSGVNKATQSQMQLVSLLSPRGEDFRILGEHSLLRERVDNSLAIPDAERAALFRISKQRRDRPSKGWAIVAGNDEVTIILAHDCFHISNIYCCNGSARRHRLEQGVRHLFCIGRQSK